MELDFSGSDVQQLNARMWAMIAHHHLGDLLIAQVGGSPADGPTAIAPDLKGNGSGVVAFDKYTGKVRYKITSLKYG